MAMSAFFGIGVALVVEGWCKIRDEKNGSPSSREGSAPTGATREGNGGREESEGEREGMK